jgi:Icc-related predicted phosphoesterase
MACLLTHGREEVCKEFVGGIKSIYFINYGLMGTITYNTATDLEDEIEEIQKLILKHCQNNISLIIHLRA